MIEREIGGRIAWTRVTLAPDESETVADVFYRAKPHPQAPRLARPGS